MGIKWHESLSIGVAVIDNQHKELVARFDQLLKACEANQGVSELNRTMAFLNEYVIKHFHDEEELQRKHNYPNYDAHRKEHESFTTRIKSLQQEIVREGMSTRHIIETNNILITWLVDHISSSDAEIGKFLKSQQP